MICVYIYDTDANCIHQRIDGLIVINSLVDTNRDYAQVLEERDGSGKLLARYVYGHDLISQTRGTATSYYLYDGLGSTRALTNAAGVVTDTYTYDAFGNLLDKTGSTANEYLYAGELFDSHLHFYYLRARYLNAALGRFVTMDTFAGRSRDPLSLHKYLYAHANPVNRVDPSGYMDSIQLQGSEVIQGELLKMPISIATRTVVMTNIVLPKTVLIVDTTQIVLSYLLLKGLADLVDDMVDSDEEDDEHGIVTVYHGTVDNYEEIIENGLDPAKAPSYVGKDEEIALDAIFNRYDVRENIINPCDNGGIIASDIPQNIWKSLIQNGSIIERGDYPGFSRILNAVEYQLRDAAAIHAFNLYRRPHLDLRRRNR